MSDFFWHVAKNGIFSFSRIFLRFKIDFSAHFDPENMLGCAIGRLLKNWVFEVFGDFWVPDWVSASLFTNFQFGRLGFNFWEHICFLGQFLTLNRMSVSKTTFDNHNLVIWPHLSQKTSFWPDLVCFWLKRGQMTHFYCSKVAFDLLIRFSVKNWPRKHICSQKSNPNLPNWKLVQKAGWGWDPVWDPRSPQKLIFQKSSNCTLDCTSE